MLDPATIAIITFTFVLAGLVKGVVGLGLPTVSLGLLVASFDLTTAMALLIAPSFATNLWQATSGGNLLLLVRRLWQFLLMAMLAVWFGSQALVSIDLALLSVLLGALLIAYALLSLSGFRIVIAENQERRLGPILGVINGLLTGMTGSFVLPGVLYLQGLGLSRDALIQAMGILFTVSTVALGIALQYRGFSTAELSLVSIAAVLPAIAGMWLGQQLRQKLSEQHFRAVFFYALLALGAYIVIKSYLTVT